MEMVSSNEMQHSSSERPRQPRRSLLNMVKCNKDACITSSQIYCKCRCFFWSQWPLSRHVNHNAAQCLSTAHNTSVPHNFNSTKKKQHFFHDSLTGHGPNQQHTNSPCCRTTRNSEIYKIYINQNRFFWQDSPTPKQTKQSNKKHVHVISSSGFRRGVFKDSNQAILFRNIKKYSKEAGHGVTLNKSPNQKTNLSLNGVI